MEKSEKKHFDKANQMKKTFGEQMKATRDSKKWALQNIYLECGIAETVLSRIERGKKNVTLPTMFRIIWAFGLEVSDFFDQECYERPKE